MKKKIVSSVLLALSGAVLCGSQVFATNQYGIEYSGGVDLSAQNVTVDADLIDGLTSLIDSSEMQVTFSNSAKWQTGYFRTTATPVEGQQYCFPAKYFKVWENSTSPSDGISFTLSDSKYALDIRFDNVAFDGASDLSESNSYAVSVGSTIGTVEGGREVYSDSACNNQISGVKALHINDGAKLFAQVHTTLHKVGSTSPVVSDQMYTLIADIDASQSYKILNSDSLLKKGNMFARSISDLQPTDTEYRNKYVASGNYIYSEDAFNIDNTSNIYAKLGTSTQQNGMDLVLGYAHPAGSWISFFGKQYTINYESDENGEVTGIVKEDVLSGEHPAGSVTEPGDGYLFSHWIADVDVTLADGTVIKAGEVMSSEQVELVIVEQDITFTGIHVIDEPEDDKGESGAKVPDTGEFTGVNSAIFIIVPVWAVLMIALGSRFAYKNATKKQVKFSKK